MSNFVRAAKNSYDWAGQLGAANFQMSCVQTSYDYGAGELRWKFEKAGNLCYNKKISISAGATNQNLKNSKNYSIISIEDERRI